MLKVDIFPKADTAKCWNNTLLNTWENQTFLLYFAYSRTFDLTDSSGDCILYWKVILRKKHLMVFLAEEFILIFFNYSFNFFILEIACRSSYLMKQLSKTTIFQIFFPPWKKSYTAWKVSKYGVFSSPYSVRMRENTDQEKLRIWTHFTQWYSNLGTLECMRLNIN